MGRSNAVGKLSEEDQACILAESLTSVLLSNYLSVVGVDKGKVTFFDISFLLGCF
jgi:hypothetical protein